MICPLMSISFYNMLSTSTLKEIIINNDPDELDTYYIVNKMLEAMGNKK